MVLLGQKVLQVRLVVEVQNVVRAPRADAAQAEPETLQSYLDVGYNFPLRGEGYPSVVDTV